MLNAEGGSEYVYLKEIPKEFLKKLMSLKKYLKESSNGYLNESLEKYLKESV